MVEKEYVYIDESGNFGTDGRYFTISAVRLNDQNKIKTIRAMKRCTLKVKQKFPTNQSDCGEVKANLCNPIAKDYVLRKLGNTDFLFNCIIADLNHIEPRLLKNQNILYNYLLKFLIEPVVRENPNLNSLHIIIDKRTIKVGKLKMFEDYIKAHIWTEMERSNVDILVEYMESHNSYGVQMADFLAHVSYKKYEQNIPYFYDLISHKNSLECKFPYQRFGR